MNEFEGYTKGSLIKELALLDKRLTKALKAGGGTVFSPRLQKVIRDEIKTIGIAIENDEDLRTKEQALQAMKDAESERRFLNMTVSQFNYKTGEEEILGTVRSLYGDDPKAVFNVYTT